MADLVETVARAICEQVSMLAGDEDAWRSHVPAAEAAITAISQHTGLVAENDLRAWIESERMDPSTSPPTRRMNWETWVTGYEAALRMLEAFLRSRASLEADV